ncbi:MAG: hypothetical protein HS108_06830 [Planctomycetes bacterium]|jgi:hypothetical protein|nr:hypothetical protein [Planctomycetota bacterium]MCL4730082.1 hypothetical protein [Planctomycetota bacterium]
MHRLALLCLLLVAAAEARAYYQYDVSSAPITYQDLVTPNLVVLADDAISGPIAPAGFQFSYFGTLYSSFCVASNGYMVLGTTGVVSPVPDHATPPGLVVAPCWVDLFGNGGVAVGWKYDAAARRLIVEWRDILVRQNLPSTFRAVRMQVVLTMPDGRIEFRYGKPNGLGGPVDGPVTAVPHTVAVSGPAVTGGTQMFNNGTIPGWVNADGSIAGWPDGRAIYFDTRPPGMVNPLPFSVQAGQGWYEDFNTWPVENGVAPYTWMDAGAFGSGTPLPAGWSVTGGVLYAPGNTLIGGDWHIFSMIVVDGLGRWATISVEVNVVGQPVIHASGPLTCPVGHNYALSLTALYGTAPYTWTLVSGQLPPGVVWPASTTGPQLTLHGVPDTPGMYTFMVELADAQHAVQRQFSIEVTPVSAGPGGRATRGGSSGCVGGAVSGAALPAWVLVAVFTLWRKRRRSPVRR